MELVKQAILAGIFNDLGSGSNVDVCVISKTHGTKYLRNYRTPNERKYRAPLPGYRIPKGTTEWLKETKEIFKNRVEVEDMDVDEEDDE